MASFLIIAVSPNELDAALDILEGDRLGGEIHLGADIINILPDSLQLGM